MELHRLDPEAERRQVERTRRVRAERDAAAVEARARARCGRPRAARRTCSSPSARRSRRYATVGEICNVLRDEFGTYDAHLAP